MNHLQKRRLLLAFITLWLSIFMIGVYQMSKAHASAFYYNSNNLPPRTQQLCYNEFIGVEYNPMHERRCRGLWTSWTGEIKNSNSANQY